MVILQYMPVCYKFCYFCIRINSHQFKICRASQIPRPRLQHSPQQPINIQKSHSLTFLVFYHCLAFQCLEQIRNTISNKMHSLLFICLCSAEEKQQDKLAEDTEEESSKEWTVQRALTLKLFSGTKTQNSQSRAL